MNINENLKINPNKIEFESNLETIKLLIGISNINLNQKALDNVTTLISWVGCGDIEDNIYVDNIIEKSLNNMDNYFHQKDLKEMKEREERYPNLNFTKI